VKDRRLHDATKSFIHLHMWYCSAWPLWSMLWYISMRHISGFRNASGSRFLCLRNWAKLTWDMSLRRCLRFSYWA
jgi:hypothetical protein